MKLKGKEVWECSVLVVLYGIGVAYVLLLSSYFSDTPLREAYSRADICGFIRGVLQLPDVGYVTEVERELVTLWNGSNCTNQYEFMGWSDSIPEQVKMYSITVEG